MKIVLEEQPPRVVPPLKIKVEYAAGAEQDQLSALEKEIKSACSHSIKINPQIIWVPPNTFEKSLRKTSPFEKTYE